MERDGKSIPVPRYDEGRCADCLEGAVAVPAVLIEHENVIAPEPAQTLPVWPGPHAPPPLVAHLYAPYVSPR
jgi:hypothetical protein